jgi:hypothetical protein
MVNADITKNNMVVKGFAILFYRQKGLFYRQHTRNYYIQKHHWSFRYFAMFFQLHLFFKFIDIFDIITINKVHLEYRNVIIKLLFGS